MTQGSVTPKQKLVLAAQSILFLLLVTVENREDYRRME
jgi:hypothetical protein